MSLINTRVDKPMFKRMLSDEEIEIKNMFPDMDVFDRIIISNDYHFWKITKKDADNLTFNDFIDALNGKKFEEKPIDWSKLKEVAIKSMNAEILTPKPNK